MKNMRPIIAFTFIIFLGLSQLFALNPSRTYKQKPDKFNMEYKELKVKTNDGEAELNVWDFPANVKTTKLILICHNGEGNMGDYLRKVDQFTSIGYNVVLFDYRGFGESSEFEIDNNMYIYPHFQNDVESMIDYCRKNHVAKFNIYGWGIGAGMATGIGFYRQEIEKIIADTPFLSMEDLEDRFSDWDEPMEVPFAGYDKKHEPIYTLDGVPANKDFKGIQIIIGSNDILFKVSDMQKLTAKQKKFFDKKTGIHVIDNPDQKDNFTVDKSGYFKAIHDFLDS